MQRSTPKTTSLILSILAVLALFVGQWSAAYADNGSPTNKEICEAKGGTWEEAETNHMLHQYWGHVRARPARWVGDHNGVGAQNGTCTYPSGNPEAVSVCGEDHILRRVYGDLGVANYCEYAHPGPPFPYGECGDRHEGPVIDPVTLMPCGGYGTYATFGVGGCAASCTVGTQLPVNANRSLPEDASATLYVMTRGEGGTPSNDGYSACFENFDRLLLTLYRFVSGSWQAQITSSANPICAGASGDGAFYISLAE